jgi:hypothetical protein
MACFMPLILPSGAWDDLGVSCVVFRLTVMAGWAWQEDAAT